LEKFTNINDHAIELVMTQMNIINPLLMILCNPGESGEKYTCLVLKIIGVILSNDRNNYNDTFFKYDILDTLALVLSRKQSTLVWKSSLWILSNLCYSKNAEYSLKICKHKILDVVVLSLLHREYCICSEAIEIVGNMVSTDDMEVMSILFKDGKLF
jgi:hypothetical protein